MSKLKNLMQAAIKQFELAESEINPDLKLYQIQEAKTKYQEAQKLADKEPEAQREILARLEKIEYILNDIEKEKQETLVPTQPTLNSFEPGNSSIAADGDCLFRAVLVSANQPADNEAIRIKRKEVAHELKFNEKYHIYIRGQIKDNIKRGLKGYKGEFLEQLSSIHSIVYKASEEKREQILDELVTEEHVIQYIKGIENGTIWGGHLELSILQEILDIDIELHQPGNVYSLKGDQAREKEIKLWYNGEDHYDLYKNQDQEQQKLETVKAVKPDLSFVTDKTQKHRIKDYYKLTEAHRNLEQAIELARIENFEQMSQELIKFAENIHSIKWSFNKTHGDSYIRNKYGLLKRYLSKGDDEKQRGIPLLEGGIDFENLVYLRDALAEEGKFIRIIKSNLEEFVRDLEKLDKKICYALYDTSKLDFMSKFTTLGLDASVFNEYKFSEELKFDILSKITDSVILLDSVNNIKEALVKFRDININPIHKEHFDLSDRCNIYDLGYSLIILGEKAKNIKQLTDIDFIINQGATEKDTITFKDILGKLGKLRDYVKTQPDFLREANHPKLILAITELKEIEKLLTPTLEEISNQIESNLGNTSINLEFRPKDVESLVVAYQKTVSFITNLEKEVKTSKKEEVIAIETIKKPKPAGELSEKSKKLIGAVTFLQKNKGTGREKNAISGFQKAKDAYEAAYNATEEKGNYPSIKDLPEEEILKLLEEAIRVSGVTKDERSREDLKLENEARDKAIALAAAKPNELKRLNHTLDVLLEEAEFQMKLQKQMEQDLLKKGSIDSRIRRAFITSQAIIGNIHTKLLDINQFPNFNQKIKASFNNEIRRASSSLINIRNSKLMHGDIESFDSLEALFAFDEYTRAWVRDIEALKVVLNNDLQELKARIKALGDGNLKDLSTLLHAASYYFQAISRLNSKSDLEIIELAYNKFTKYENQIDKKDIKDYIDLIHAYVCFLVIEKDYIKAWPLVQKELELKKKFFREETYYIASSENNFINVLRHIDTQACEEYIKQVDFDHKLSDTLIPTKARILFKTNEQAAIKLLQEFISYSPKNSFVLINAYIELSICYKAVSNHQAASDCAKKALSIFYENKTFLITHYGIHYLPQYVQILLFVANELEDLGKIPEATHYLKKASKKARMNLEIQRLSELDIDITLSLASLYSKARMYDQAIIEYDYIEKKLEHLSLAKKYSYYYGLAILYQYQEKYSKFDEALANIEKLPQDELSQKNQATIYAIAIDVYRKNNQIEKAQFYINKLELTKNSNTTYISTEASIINLKIKELLASDKQIIFRELFPFMDKLRALTKNADLLSLELQQNNYGVIYVSIFNIYLLYIQSKHFDNETFNTFAEGSKVLAEEIKTIIIEKGWINPENGLKECAIECLFRAASYNDALEEAIEYLNALTPEKFPDYSQGVRYRHLGHAYKNIARKIEGGGGEKQSLEFYEKALQSYNKALTYPNTTVNQNNIKTGIEDCVTAIKKLETFSKPKLSINIAWAVKTIMRKIGVIVARQNLKILEDGAPKVMDEFKINCKNIYEAFEYAEIEQKLIKGDIAELLRSKFNNTLKKVELSRDGNLSVVLDYREAIKLYFEEIYGKNYPIVAVKPTIARQQQEEFAKFTQAILSPLSGKYKTQAIGR